jgi:N4-gp56 family major capsid protein
MKKEITELALGTADVTAITPKVLSKTIEEIRRLEKVWGQFYKTNTDLMNNGGTQVEFPKKQIGISVSWGLSPGQGPTQSSIPYTATTITIAKGGIGLAIQGEAIRQANRDVVADQVQEAGLVWKDTLDLVAMEQMFPSVTVVAANSICALPGTIVIGVKSTIGDFSSASITVSSSGTTIGTFSGATNATVSVWYVPSTTNRRAASTTSSVGSVSPKDVLKLKSDITGKAYSPSVLIMHSNMFAELIYDPSVKFVEKSAYEGEGVVYTGEIGKLWGMKVIVSDLMPQFGIALIDPQHLGYEVVRKELDLKRDEYTGASADVLYFWGFSERNFGIVNPYSYGAVYAIGTIAAGNWAVQGGKFGGLNP